MLEGREGDQRDIVLLWDEINTIGVISFKVIKGRYQFYGLSDRPNPAQLFRDPKAKPQSRGAALEGLRATHALVFQVRPDALPAHTGSAILCAPAHPHPPLSCLLLRAQACIVGDTSNGEEKVVRRVVGVHAVRNCVAEELDVLFWDTVANLKEKCDATVVAGVCDGASVNRLQQKMNTSGQGRGTPNLFIKVSNELGSPPCPHPPASP